MKILKILLFLLIFLSFSSIILLLFYLFNQSFNIACIRIMSSILLILLLFFLIEWELYINDVQYKHLKKSQTESACYKAAKPMSCIKGIAIFCTEADNPYLNNYVDFNNELGFNKKRNHWNNVRNFDMPHEFIGYDKNDDVVIINTIPYAYTCFSNDNIDTVEHRSFLDNYIKIYICREVNQNKDYFNKVVCGALVNLCSKLCKKYNLKPNRIILDARSNDSICHGICADWFAKNQYSINQLRFEVKARNTPIMLFAEDFLKVLQWFKSFYRKK